MNFIYGNYIKKLRLAQKTMNEDGRLLPSRKEISRILQDFRRVRRASKGAARKKWSEGRLPAS